jgi:serine/threonine-protein kinase HipA
LSCGGQEKTAFLRWKNEWHVPHGTTATRIAAVLDLLKGSDDPEADRRMFLKAQIMFWLLGATDGHAKNFSTFLRPGSRFRLTPLYDVMSAQPALDRGQLRKNKMKLALAVGDNRHYVVDEIMPRHFVQSAAKSGMPESVVQGIFDEILDTEQAAVLNVLEELEELPDVYPEGLAQSIIKGLQSRLLLVRCGARRPDAARRGACCARWVRTRLLSAR